MTQRNARTLPKALKLAGLALAASAVCAPAFAVDWGGYFRTGPGGSKKDAQRACYGLPGEGMKYRLGNECDFYGEFLLSQGFEKDGVNYKAHLMTNLYEGNTDGDTSKVGINQMYVEGKGFDIAPGANFWIGKRFYGRADVHIVDTFFTNMSGTGAGMNEVDVGVGKFALAYFHTDAANERQVSGNRINAELYDIAVNPGGKLRLIGTYTDGNFSDDPRTAVVDEGKDGFGFTVQHNQEISALGGSNTLWVQLAQGSAGLNGNFANLSAPSGNKSWRVVDGLTWQLGAFGGQAMVMLQQDKVDGGGDTDSISVGGRASYAFTKHFKLVAEAGYSQRKPDGGATQKLTKFTLAPTLSTGPGFWNRPELRLYVTTAKWNDAAAPFMGLPAPAFNGKTKGTSYGAQVEIWF
ncbi:maltoporin [Methylibium rhizosphaerae]|uniref:maltoporin n=1 Tax=Methylibium rhizosphaerae TaxID=2570323 RepID=UPI00112E8C46|nr:carbohydrate porin [Methylibium rhizosphaerae]